MLHFRARKMQTRSNPSNAGTKHLMMIAAGATSPAAFCPDTLAHFTRIADKRGRADDGCLQNRAY